MTIREKWEKALKCKTSTFTNEYLSGKYPLAKAENNLLINGSVCPNENLISDIDRLKNEHVLLDNEIVIAARLSGESLNIFNPNKGIAGSFSTTDSTGRQINVDCS